MSLEKTHKKYHEKKHIQQLKAYHCQLSGLGGWRFTPIG
jgi:hypothetical protein